MQLAGWVVCLKVKQWAERTGLPVPPEMPEQPGQFAWEKAPEEDIVALERWLEEHSDAPDRTYKTTTNVSAASRTNALAAEIEAALDAPVPEWLR